MNYSERPATNPRVKIIRENNIRTSEWSLKLFTFYILNLFIFTIATSEYRCVLEMVT
jgi:hypothetical protein